MPDFQRDITLTGGTNDFFVAPAQGLYWFYNPPTNASITFSKAGKAPQIISAGEVAVVTLAQGEEVALSGTANQILSVYDHFDVKLIPAGRDVLGKVQIVDATVTSQGLLVTPAGSINVNQNLLGFADQPDITVNQSAVGGLKTSEQVRLGAADNPDITVNQSAVTGLKVNIASSHTIPGAGTFPPTSIGSATAETVKVTGTATLTAGATVYYNLAVSGTSLTTPANDLTYIAIKGATTNAYWAVAYINEAQSGILSGITEKLNIVTRNQDTANHTMSATWVAVSSMP